jgi:hypothetical protein
LCGGGGGGGGGETNVRDSGIIFVREFLIFVREKLFWSGSTSFARELLIFVRTINDLNGSVALS